MKKLICIVLASILLLSLTACGQAKPAETVPETQAAPPDMAALYETMTDKLPGMLVLEADMMMSFCGIDAADCTQVVAAIADAGMAVDEIWLAEAKDEAAADKIEELAATRLRMKGEETVSYAPDLYAIVEKGQFIREGNYLAFIVTPEADALAELVKNAFN